MGRDGLCWITTPLSCLLQIVRRYSDFDLLNNSLQVNILKYQWYTWLPWGVLETSWKWHAWEQEISKFPWQREQLMCHSKYKLWGTNMWLTAVTLQLCTFVPHCMLTTVTGWVFSPLVRSGMSRWIAGVVHFSGAGTLSDASHETRLQSQHCRSVFSSN